MTNARLTAWVRAGVTTGMVDGLWACILSAGFYGSTVMRLWQGVASTLLGPSALDGGATTALIGVAMHFGVAFAWSGIFLLIVMNSARLRRTIEIPGRAAVVAAVYGPLIWVTMSLVVIPLLTQRPLTFTTRWWIQLAGHFPFVGLPIVLSVASVLNRTEHSRGK